jgi:hypothetical protein
MRKPEPLFQAKSIRSQVSDEAPFPTSRPSEARNPTGLPLLTSRVAVEFTAGPSGVPSLPLPRRSFNIEEAAQTHQEFRGSRR